MKNFCISIIALLLISCKATQYRTVSIDASKEDVWKVVSRLGDIHNYSALDSASITPPGEAKVGSIVFVTQGKNHGKSEVTFVEPSKTIKTKEFLSYKNKKPNNSHKRSSSWYSPRRSITVICYTPINILINT